MRERERQTDRKFQVQSENDKKSFDIIFISEN